MTLGCNVWRSMYVGEHEGAVSKKKQRPTRDKKTALKRGWSCVGEGAINAIAG